MFAGYQVPPSFVFFTSSFLSSFPRPFTSSILSRLARHSSDSLFFLHSHPSFTFLLPSFLPSSSVRFFHSCPLQAGALLVTSGGTFPTITSGGDSEDDCTCTGFLAMVSFSLLTLPSFISSFPSFPSFLPSFLPFLLPSFLPSLLPPALKFPDCLAVSFEIRSYCFEISYSFDISH